MQKKIKRGWRITRFGRDSHKYSERFEGKWRSIEIDGEMYARGTPKHAIYLPTDWSNYPIWAQERASIIESRIREELKSPTYIYL
ncbi:MAG: hypothetical protein ABJG68_11305 [Crocinitomicaceae bacterium]